MPEFVTVENKNLGKRARVLARRVPHLIDDWQVVEDDEPPAPRKRAARKTTAAAAIPVPDAAPADAEQPESAAGADDQEQE